MYETEPFQDEIIVQSWLDNLAHGAWLGRSLKIVSSKYRLNQTPCITLTLKDPPSIDLAITHSHLDRDH